MFRHLAPCEVAVTGRPARLLCSQAPETMITVAAQRACRAGATAMTPFVQRAAFAEIARMGIGAYQFDERIAAEVLRQ